MSSNDPRPLWRAMSALAEECGWIIDYEDPVYSENDATARVDPGFLASRPGKTEHVVTGTILGHNSQRLRPPEHRAQQREPSFRRSLPITTSLAILVILRSSTKGEAGLPS